MTRILRGSCCKFVLLSVFIGAQRECSSHALGAEDALVKPTAKDTREHDELLTLVTIPTSALPKHVRLTESIRTTSLIPVTRNPDVLGETQLTMPFALFFGIKDKSDLAPVRGGIVAVYQEKHPANEIGVYGLCFTDEETAKKRFEKLAKDTKDSPFILKGRLLLFVWKDDGVSNLAFEAVRDYLRTVTFKPAHRS